LSYEKWIDWRFDGLDKFKTCKVLIHSFPLGINYVEKVFGCILLA